MMMPQREKPLKIINLHKIVPKHWNQHCITTIGTNDSVAALTKTGCGPSQFTILTDEHQSSQSILSSNFKHSFKNNSQAYQFYLKLRKKTWHGTKSWIHYTQDTVRIWNSYGQATNSKHSSFAYYQYSSRIRCIMYDDLANRPFGYLGPRIRQKQSCTMHRTFVSNLRSWISLAYTSRKE